MPSPADPIAFSLFGIEIRWYALFMLAGIVAGVMLTRALAARLDLDADWTLDAAPWIVLVMMSFQRDSLQAYSSPAGVLVLAVGAGVTVVAYRLMVRIGRLPEEARVLR